MYAEKKYVGDPGAGHKITTEKQTEDIRFSLQNTNGVMGGDTKFDDRRALLSLREWGVDVISLPEKTVSGKEWLHNKWKGKITRVW